MEDKSFDNFENSLDKDKLFEALEKRLGKVNWEFLGSSFRDDNREVVLFANNNGDSAFRYLLNRGEEYSLEDYPWCKD